MHSDVSTSPVQWITRRRSLLALAAGVWLTCGAIQCAQSFVYARAVGRAWTLSGALVTGMPWWLSWLALTPLIAWLAERFAIRRDQPWRAFGLHAVAGAGVSLVQVCGVGAIYWFTTGRFSGVATSLANQVQRYFGNFWLESIVTYAATAGAFTAIDFARAVRDGVVHRAQLEARAATLEASVAQARLDALSMQMNPHFLFNTLAAISGLVAQERRAEAREVIQRLGELLRQTLGYGSGPVSTVAREALLLEDYLYIQRMRFNDRLEVQVDIAADARDCALPSMLLQPLVENAIRHGVEKTEGKGAVSVGVRRENGTLEVRIVDSGPGFPLDARGHLVREGIGIANTRERLERMYGGGATLGFRNVAGGGEVRVTIPVESRLPSTESSS